MTGDPGGRPARSYGGEAADALPARGALFRVTRQSTTHLALLPASACSDSTPSRRLRVSRQPRTVTVDRIVSGTAPAGPTILIRVRLDLGTRSSAPLSGSLQ